MIKVSIFTVFIKLYHLVFYHYRDLFMYIM